MARAKWTDAAEQEDLDPTAFEGPRANPGDVPQPETRATDPAAVEAALGAPGAPVSPDPAPRRRPGRPRKRKAPEAPLAPLPPDPVILAQRAAELREPLRVTFDLAGKVMASYRKWPGWALEPSEANMLADAWAPCLAPYMSQIAGAMPWVTAVVITYGVVAPRLNAEAEARKNATHPEGVPFPAPVPDAPAE